MRVCFSIALGFWLTCSVAWAQSVELSVDADRCAIAYALTGRAIDGCNVPNIANVQTRSAQNQVTGHTDGYYVYFDLNSNALDQAARTHLDRLSRLLSGPLRNLCIKLVGHTDTTGSSAHNLALSEMRARSVRQFLAGPGAISSARLFSEGRGESMPLPDTIGTDPKNRRVEILGKTSNAGNCG